MAKFRKKPVVIEAVQWWPSVPINGVIEVKCTCGDTSHLNDAYIKTLEGNMKVSPGDWVITGIKGEKYPCKPDIFEQTYDPVQEDSSFNIVRKFLDGLF